MSSGRRSKSKDDPDLPKRSSDETNVNEFIVKQLVEETSLKAKPCKNKEKAQCGGPCIIEPKCDEAPEENNMCCPPKQESKCDKGKQKGCPKQDTKGKGSKDKTKGCPPKESKCEEPAVERTDCCPPAQADTTCGGTTKDKGKGCQPKLDPKCTPNKAKCCPVPKQESKCEEPAVERPECCPPCPPCPPCPNKSKSKK